MKKQLDSVKEFHEAFGQANGLYVKNLNQDEYELRYRLMAEENDEYLQACKDNNIDEIADALGDQLYILCGTILKHGLQHKIQLIFSEIHRSNMSKLDADGKPILREDGKILKSNRYFPPDIKKILQMD
jgi:predicted HAD superfamily Cof-like phosphohydrolase